MLELRNLSFGVEAGPGKKEILKDISLTVGEDKFVVITGPNGGGKSTLAKIIAGIVKPQSGQIILNGEDITDLDEVMPYVKHLHCNHTPEGTVDREYLTEADEELITSYKNAIAKYGYDGTFSVEPNDTPDFDVLAPKTLAVMRKVFA